jgi:hypothetical protein
MSKHKTFKSFTNENSSSIPILFQRVSKKLIPFLADAIVSILVNFVLIIIYAFMLLSENSEQFRYVEVILNQIAIAFINFYTFRKVLQA